MTDKCDSVPKCKTSSTAEERKVKMIKLFIKLFRVDNGGENLRHGFPRTEFFYKIHTNIPLYMYMLVHSKRKRKTK